MDLKKRLDEEIDIMSRAIASTDKSNLDRLNQISAKAIFLSDFIFSKLEEQDKWNGKNNLGFTYEEALKYFKELNMTAIRASKKIGMSQSSSEEEVFEHLIKTMGSKLKKHYGY